MKLVIGLGNPGNRYNFTRHNSGFLALDFYFKLHNLTWGAKPRYGALWGRRGDIIFVKPQDYYNESGRATLEFMNFYKIPTSDILVICDDFNLEFGKLRYRAQGSAGGNNGLKSIISTLGTDEFPRLRIGTGNDTLRRQMGDMDFVLSKFTPEEKLQLPEILSEVAGRIDEYAAK
ncbi:aminoacyl-tRNA hydrolase [Candidatus Saccharibacteria bacterium]|nr:aminoacyl-tRNA hydrolase [Candidatus Saccharibacteria bacterium]